MAGRVTGQSAVCMCIYLKAENFIWKLEIIMRNSFRGFGLVQQCHGLAITMCIKARTGSNVGEKQKKKKWRKQFVAENNVHCS